MTTDNKSRLQRITLFPERSLTVLQQLEHLGFRVPYQCRSGFCGACRMTLIGGRVEYLEEPLAFRGVNDLLACCSRVVVDVTVAFLV